MSKELTPQEFVKRFRDDVRVGFNWDRFMLEGWPVKEVVITEQHDLARCFTPWYIGPDGKEVAYDDALAVPMCVRDVPIAMQLLHDERKKDIQQYVDEFERHPSNIQFTAPTFALPDNQYFILDRNHRLSALAVKPVHFKVILWNVHGPLEKEALLDVMHWLPREKELE